MSNPNVSLARFEFNLNPIVESNITLYKKNIILIVDNAVFTLFDSISSLFVSKIQNNCLTLCFT